MIALHSIPTRRGKLYYKPRPHDLLPEFPSYFKQRQPRPSYISTAHVPEDVSEPDEEASQLVESNKRKRRRILLQARKLALPTGNRCRFLRRVSFVCRNRAKSPGTHTPPDARRPDKEEQDKKGKITDMPGTDFLRGGAINAHLRRPSMTQSVDVSPQSSPRMDTGQQIPEVSSIAAGHGVIVSVNLAEPVLFLQGFDHSDATSRSTAMLRGSLHLKVLKSAKIKAVSLRFRGQATTKWPEGIPPKKMDFEETDTLMSHTWPFFNAQFPSAEKGSGADVVRLEKESNKHGSPYLSASPITSTHNLAPRENKRLSLSVHQTRSFDTSDGGNKHGPTVAQKGYRTFQPGDYVYNFELPLDSRLPESIDVDLGSVKYELEASVERAGAFRANLLGTKEVVLIRAPSEGSLEQVEPIAISRNWEDQLHYDIVISGKSFPLGAKVPIAFKLTPLAKVQCHRVKVYVTENTEYFCSGKRVHRLEPTRKVLLFEKRADQPSYSRYPGSNMRVMSGGGIPYDQREIAREGRVEIRPEDTTNLLGSLEGDSNVGPTEMEFNVQLPGCQHSIEKDRPNSLQFDTTYTNIQVHHWIKIVLRLSKADGGDVSKRRHFEISIDSPFNILSCRASHANTALPAYSAPESVDPSSANLADCNCPGAPRRQVNPNHVPTVNALNVHRSSVDASHNHHSTTTNTATSAGAEESSSPITLARPQLAHVHTNTPAVQRPIHMLRNPSYNPPAFEAEEPPPQLMTPPPQYNDIASPTHGMADYFGRLEIAHPRLVAEQSSERPFVSQPEAAVVVAAAAAVPAPAPSAMPTRSRTEEVTAAAAVEGTVEEVDSENESLATRGRVNVPLTPGSRMTRSMDLGRVP